MRINRVIHQMYLNLTLTFLVSLFVGDSLAFANPIYIGKSYSKHTCFRLEYDESQKREIMKIAIGGLAVNIPRDLNPVVSCSQSSFASLITIYGPPAQEIMGTSFKINPAMPSRAQISFMTSENISSWLCPRFSMPALVTLRGEPMLDGNLEIFHRPDKFNSIIAAPFPHIMFFGAPVVFDPGRNYDYLKEPGKSSDYSKLLEIYVALDSTVALQVRIGSADLSKSDLRDIIPRLQGAVLRWLGYSQMPTEPNKLNKCL